MQYTEEHYAQMYNNLPEGLKDLVLSGRLAILVSAIGSRHGLSADQIADLEPAIEDVCLGLITKDELVDNIRKSTDLDMRVANRIAAEAELEILKPFEPELLISRKQKEELDEKIVSTPKTHPIVTNSQAKKEIDEPKNVSEHAQIKKVSDWYSKDEQSFKDRDSNKVEPTVSNFDWEKDFGKRPEPAVVATSEQVGEETVVPKNIEGKLDQLTESINKLVNTRFGDAGKAEPEMSIQMQELVKRLERAEKENEENKKLIQNLKGVKPVESIFGTQPVQQTIPETNLNNIPIDKERKVEINHKDAPLKKELETGNIQITSISNSIPIEKKDPAKNVQEVFSSAVSKDTLDSIVATRNKVTPIATETAPKKVLSMDELISEGDKKIKGGMPPKTATLVFPGLNDETKLDIKNLAQKDSIKQTLLDDLEFLRTSIDKKEGTEVNTNKVMFPNNSDESNGGASDAVANQNASQNNQNTNTQSQNKLNSRDTYATNPFKEELIPKTKEERMRVLQDKIKALNKGVGVGGKTNLSASSLDPYRL